MQKLIACGCSWTLGTHSKLTDPLADNSEEIWTNLKNISYAEKLPANNTIIWAQNGISNYAIACQVSDAIEYQPDFIVFNTTTTSRYEVVKPQSARGKTWCMDGMPWQTQTTEHPNNFTNDYRPGTWPRPNRTDFFDHDTQHEGTILSKSLTQFKNFAEYKDYMNYLFGSYQPGFNHIESQTVTDFYSEYSDWGLKHHTDTMIVNSTIRDLEVSGIPWICVDITGIAPDHHRVHKLDLIDMLKNHGLSDDPAHWNQQGHDQLSQDLSVKYF